MSNSCSPKTARWRKEPEYGLVPLVTINQRSDSALINPRPKEFCHVLSTSGGKVKEKKSIMKENEAEEEELSTVREFEHQNHNTPILFCIFSAKSRKAEKPHSLLKTQPKQRVRREPPSKLPSPQDTSSHCHTHTHS